MKKGVLISSIAMCSVALLNSCQCNRQTTVDFEDNIDTTLNSETLQDELNKSKTILYTLPAPVETASLIKESGVKYDEEQLHSLSVADQYNSNMKMALNLGIYSTDMSFASIFNQSQKTVEYLNTLRRLTERLGIVQLIDEQTVMKMEKQTASKDEMLNMISEVYINANQYLNENNRKSIAVMVLIGGWTEGLNIALNLIDLEKKQNKVLMERIIAQKMALATVLSIIDSNNPDDADEDLTYLKNKMTEIKLIFDEVKIENAGKVTATTDAASKTTFISVNSEIEVSPDILAYLKMKVNEIRNEFIQI